MKVAKTKHYTFTIVQIPLLLFYLIILAKSGEITVLCRETAKNLTGLEQSISIFVFFEIEVFAFFGILFGLWLWLSFKYFLNAIFQDGPRHSFKTDAVKHAKDLLMRNKIDAFTTTGIIWSFAINIFMTSGLNVARDLMA